MSDPTTTAPTAPTTPAMPPGWAPVPGLSDEPPARFVPIPGLDEPTRFAAQPPAQPSSEPPSRDTITARLRAYLAKLPRGECPFCGGTRWKPYAWAQLVLFNGPTGDALPTKTIPAIAIECEGCGFTATINATTAGILPAEQPAAAPAAR